MKEYNKIKNLFLKLESKNELRLLEKIDFLWELLNYVKNPENEFSEEYLEKTSAEILKTESFKKLTDIYEDYKWKKDYDGAVSDVEDYMDIFYNEK